MKVFRLVLVATLTAACAACSSSPSKSDAMPAKAAVMPAMANIAGVWNMTTESQMGPMETKLTITQTGKDIKGVMESPMGTVDIAGAVQGSDVKFGFDFDAQGTALRIDYTGVVEGNTAMKGKAVFGSFGEGTFTAKKAP